MYLYSVVKNPLTAKRGVLQSNLRITDMQSLYPWNGISDAVVDFYIRSASVSCTCIMPECLHNLVDLLFVGALTYIAIVKVSKGQGGNSNRLVTAHQSVNGKKDLRKSMIIFPCRTRY